MATVTFEHVTKTFKAKDGEVCAVDDLCLSVADREFVVLVGPSGCGKTTTLRLVAGLEGLGAGAIRIDGQVVNRVAPKDRDVAMVFQNYALYPHMTVYKNMAFGLRMRRVPTEEIKRKVHEVSAMLGIEHLLGRRPAALSGGERQRVAVGRAIVRKPKVFLFDEPLSNLDAKLRIHMRTEIKSLHRRLKTTIIYVTHDKEEAMTLGDRLVIMKDGVVQQCGSPLGVYNRPANRFVAGFVGTPAMNFLRGCIQDDGTRVFSVGRTERLCLPLELSQALEPHVGSTVTLGVRPEHLSIAEIESELAPRPPSEHASDKAAVIRASVTVVEPLGDRIHVHLVTPEGDPIVARVSPAASVLPGQEVKVVVDLSSCHFFSADDAEERLA